MNNFSDISATDNILPTRAANVYDFYKELKTELATLGLMLKKHRKNAVDTNTHKIQEQQITTKIDRVHKQLEVLEEENFAELHSAIRDEKYQPIEVKHVRFFGISKHVENVLVSEPKETAWSRIANLFRGNKSIVNGNYLKKREGFQKLTEAK